MHDLLRAGVAVSTHRRRARAPADARTRPRAAEFQHRRSAARRRPRGGSSGAGWRWQRPSGCCRCWRCAAGLDRRLAGDRARSATAAGSRSAAPSGRARKRPHAASRATAASTSAAGPTRVTAGLGAADQAERIALTEPEGRHGHRKRHLADGPGQAGRVHPARQSLIDLSQDVVLYRDDGTVHADRDRGGGPEAGRGDQQRQDPRRRARSARWTRRASR